MVDNKAVEAQKLDARLDASKVDGSKNLVDQLNGLIENDEGKKKLGKKLDEEVGKFLQGLSSSDLKMIEEIYEAHKDDPGAREGLERLFSLANLKKFEDVQDEQRQLNVLFEGIKQREEIEALSASKQETDDLESEILTGIRTNIEKLFEEKEYQKALDNAIYLLTDKSRINDRVSGFALIKRILEATPREVTLRIKNKKVSYYDRTKWIKKMDDNIELAAREFDETYYTDGNISGVGEYEFSDTKKQKVKKEGKAMKAVDEELSGDKSLSKILNKLNAPSAVSFIEKHYDDIIKEFNNKDTITKELIKPKIEEALKKGEYVPKDGKKVSNKEIKALTDLCYYLWENGGNKPISEILDDSHKYKIDSYKTISEVLKTGVTMSEYLQAKGIFDQIFDKEGQLSIGNNEPKDVLMILFGDLNRDGNLKNVSVRKGNVREGLDKGTVFGGQIAAMFDGALKRSYDGIDGETGRDVFNEKQVIENIEAVIQNLNGLDGFQVEEKTIVGLIKAFKEHPEALIAFRNKLMNESDSGMSIFYRGVGYVDAKIENYNNEAALRKKLDEFLNNPENKGAVESFNKKLDEIVLKELDTVEANLKKFKESDAFKTLTEGQQQKMDNLIFQLSTPEGKKQFIEGDGNSSVKALYRNFLISNIGLDLMAVDVDGEMSYGVGVSAGITSESFNRALDRVTHGALQKVEASVGLYLSDNGVTIGLGLGTGATKNLTENRRMFYNVGAGWSPFNPEAIGFSGVVGSEWNVTPHADESLDLRSPHYIGVVGMYGIGINLSNPLLDMNTVGGQVYWRKDKYEGVEKQAKFIREKTAPLFEKLFDVKEGENVTVESIIKQLQSVFKNTKGETLYRTATSMYNMFVFYESQLSTIDDKKDDKKYDKKAIVGKISEKFADSLAQNMRNQNIEKIIKEGLHISGVNIGVSYSFSDIFTATFINGGITLTSYAESEYKENQDMLDSARRGMENPDLYEIINNDTGSYWKKMGIINSFLGVKEALKYDNPSTNEQDKHARIILSKEVFEHNISVLCHPELAPYITIDENGIKLPGNADVSLARILHQGKQEFTLILGANSASGCKEISLGTPLDQSGKPEHPYLKWVDMSDNTVFGSKLENIDDYNTKIVDKFEETEVGLDGKPNDELKNFLQDNGDELVKFRLSNNNYKLFIDAIKKDKTRGDTFVAETKKYLPQNLQDLVSEEPEQAKHDIRFIYASLSRVSQTRDKQLSGELLSDKAKGYLNQLKLSAANKATLDGYIEKVVGGEALGDEEWNNMKKILGIRNGWERAVSNTPAEKLFHILTPVKKLAEARTASYERRIRAEYQTLGDKGAEVLIAARNKALQQLSGKPTASGDLMEGWIGAVAGYDLNSEINDKFVSSPKVIEGSVVSVEGEGVDIVKSHFLTELYSSDEAQFRHFKSKIIDALKGGLKEEQDLAKKWEGLEPDAFIKAILEEKTKDLEGKDVSRVSFDLSYCFFADCVNEEILLGNVKVCVHKQEKIPADHDVHYYDAVVTNDAITHSRNFTIGVAYGKGKTKENPDGGGGNTDPTPENSETEPFTDLEGLNASNITEVDFDNQTFVYNGETYSVYFTEVDGKNCMIAYLPEGGDFIVCNQGGTVVLIPREESFSWSSLKNENIVDVSFSGSESVDISKNYKDYGGIVGLMMCGAYFKHLSIHGDLEEQKKAEVWFKRKVNDQVIERISNS